MQNLRLAARYAKSLFDLSIEKGQLETVYSDMLGLQDICKKSPEFINFLRSPIIKADKKKNVMNAVTDGRVSEITAGFSRLLVAKGREAELPEIVTSFINEYKVYKGIKVLKLTTAVPVSEDIKKELISKVQERTHLKNIELVEIVDADIVGGFILQMDDLEINGSISYELSKIKKQFLNNDFIYKIR